MQELIDHALAEDLGTGDVTSEAVVPADALARARIDQKAAGVIAGLQVAEAVFRRVDPELRWHARVAEGVWREGGLVAEVAGPARSLLGRRARGAQLPRPPVRRRHAHGALRAGHRGHRRAHPRHAQDHARAARRSRSRRCVAGGGHNHRVGLFDAMLVKENHSALGGGVGEATRRALAAAPEGMRVEVECATLAEVDEALEAGATSILLDNMSLDELREAVARAGGRAETEASGGVTLDTVRAMAETGVDWISVGALTHSAPALDLSLLMEPL